MHEMNWVITGEQQGMSIQNLLRGQLKISYTQYKRLKFHEGIYVDGMPRRSDYRLSRGESLKLVFRNDAGPRPLSGSQPLVVAYEDNDLLMVNKPAPLHSISSKQGGETLENRVFSYLGEPADFVYRPINRLDKGTSGLMLVAKNAHIQQRMQKKLHSQEFLREYLAITVGHLPQSSGRIDLPIGHGAGIRRVVDADGQAALTFYEVVHTKGDLSLVAIRLITGRTHQIRVHLGALGCPVYGDFLYGQEEVQMPGRFALHSCSVKFFHPLLSRWVQASADMPPEMQEIIGPPASWGCMR
ncbi:MAG: RluA family pseudouridine synthase [Clostridiales bacterium]|nr:RluA family pseudouridine synthase [Clostridiales bacterium]